MIDSSADTDLSRRSLVKTAAATAAVAGGVLALAGPAGTADAAEATAQPQHLPAARTVEHEPAGEGVLVRVLDARLGTLEVYTEHGHRTVTDRALAAQLARLGR